MWFRNLCLYRFSKPFSPAPDELEEQLAGRAFPPLNRLQPATMGWYPPLGREGRQLLHSAGGCHMLCARNEEKILPATAVRELLDARIDEIQEREGRKVRGKEKQRLKDEVLLDMLPRAFSRSRNQYAYLDLKQGWLVVDTASRNRAEAFLSLLRVTLGSLPVVPLGTQVPPSEVMTRWLAEKKPPAGFEIGDECELRAPGEEGGIVRIRNEELFSSEVESHLDAGKQVTRLALLFDQRIRFLVDEQLQVKRLRFEDMVLDEAAQGGAETPAEQFDADFNLMTLELGRFLPRLLALFGGVPEQS
ncbi:MAG TPA: recombination-associated protein RdgC [Chromatiaceae bacterium]|nr:recombination-associated protein RdgC [Chromatiaceae bacterium]